jgi:type II secretory pathway component PulC
MYLACKINVIFILGMLSLNNVWAFDPMAPPGFQQNGGKAGSTVKNKSTSSSYILRQIVIRSDRKNAVINGVVVTEGEYVKKALVKFIGENKVILQVSGRQKTLYLKTNKAKVRQ